MYEHLDINKIPKGRDYKPSLTIHSLNSKGQSARIFGIKTERQHDLLSINEQNYFYIAEFSDRVIDIREQFPMNIDKTLLIAQQLGLKHPIDPKKKQPNHMTSDFCITVMDGGINKDIIRTVKPAKELVHRRTMEKYEIERVYWEKEGIEWGLVTDQEIDKMMAKNISTFRVAYDISDIRELQELGETVLIAYKRELARRLVSENYTTRDTIHSFAQEHHLSEGSCMTLFRHLLAIKVLRSDLRSELNLSRFNKFCYSHEEVDKLLIAE